MMTCCVCLSDQYRPFLERNDYHVVQCQTCGFLFVHPAPSHDQVEAFYQNPDYFRGGGAYGYAFYPNHREEIQRQANERLRLIERLVGRGRLLDLGCATGVFLNLAKTRGWQVEGVEISDVVVRSAEQSLGRSVARTLAAASYPKESFDAVTLWEYIEHIVDPREELLRLHRLLKPGGLIALSTPNAGQRRVRRQPGAWREFKPPEHLHFFTVDTLTRLLRACGFEPIKIKAILPDVRPPAWADRWINQCRRTLGDRHSPVTPFWWIYSITRRMLTVPTALHHKLLLSRLDYCQGIEVYAGKGLNPLQRTEINTNERGI